MDKGDDEVADLFWLPIFHGYCYSWWGLCTDGTIGRRVSRVWGEMEGGGGKGRNGGDTVDDGGLSLRKNQTTPTTPTLKKKM